MTDDPANAITPASTAKQPQTFLGRYYTNLVLTGVYSLMAFLLLMCVLEVFNFFDGGTRNYSVAGSPFHITSPWPWSVKAGFWLMGALLVEAKLLGIAAVAGIPIAMLRARITRSTS